MLGPGEQVDGEHDDAERDHDGDALGYLRYGPSTRGVAQRLRVRRPRVAVPAQIPDERAKLSGARSVGAEVMPCGASRVRTRDRSSAGVTSPDRVRAFDLPVPADAPGEFFGTCLVRSQVLIAWMGPQRPDRRRRDPRGVALTAAMPTNQLWCVALAASVPGRRLKRAAYASRDDVADPWRSAVP